MRPEDMIQAAMIGQRIEQIPKNFDFLPQVERISQVLSFDLVNGFNEQLRNSNSVEDSMMVTGLRMTTNTQNSGNGGFPMSQHQNDTDYLSNYNNNSSGIGAVQQYQNGYKLQQTGKASNNGSGFKAAAAFRNGSNERKSSIGGDSSSPFPQGAGGLVGHTLSPNHMLDGSFRLGANLSK